MQGNVMDLAVGVIIGGAFQKIVSSLVNDIIMPIIGVILGGYNFTELSYGVGDSIVLYGSFLQNVIDFVIIAFVIFMTIRTLNRVSRMKKTAEPAQ